MAEIHLLIIWSKGLNKKKEIIADLKERFKIIKIYNVTWSDKNFSSNLSRFYGENLPKNSTKEKHCGKDSFCCVILEDSMPIYESRLTSKGTRIVNSNLFDIKQIYRSWTGGGHKIHATDNIKETKLQLALLFGESYSELLNSNISFSNEINHKKDLVGANGWESFDELFSIMNITSQYVVLRNFDNLENQLTTKHPDIDLLVENKNLVINILNAKKTTKLNYRVQYNVIIGDKNINFDIRYIGDNYYDLFWEKEIIRSRILHKKGFYIPNEINHFYSLIYHALVHKKYVSEDYNVKFVELSKNMNSKLSNNQLVDYKLLEILDDFMFEKRYNYVEPIDLTVYYNNSFILIDNVTLKRNYRIRFYKMASRIKNIYRRIRNVFK